MSSTNRNMKRNDKDYYITPIHVVKEFIGEVPSYFFNGLILDPCAGGDALNPMSYPTALNEMGYSNIKTIDIRKDSKAELKANYLETKLNYKPDVIITNPPFDISRQIIDKALYDVKKNGYVIMLLRLNYFGSRERKNLWDNKMPVNCYVHHKRISFVKGGGTDSIEYAHFIWQKDNYPEFTELKVI